MLHILIIDDDKAVLSATKFLLVENGFDVVAIADGQSGIEAIKDRRFDLDIVDLFMPGMNGLDTTKAILKISPLTPVIVASGFMFGGSYPEMPNFEAMAMEAGAKAVQYKPIRPKGFLKAVQKAIGMAA
jgi:two-component system response regulator (stage 0 sporulation protein F)